MEVPLEWVRRIKEVRSLQHGELGVLLEPPQCNLQKAAGGHMVAVEDSNVGCGKLLERAIDISSLGVFIISACYIADLRLFTEFAKFLPPPVVEHVHMKFVGRIIDILSRKCRTPHNHERLVVGWNENVHMGPLLH